MSFETWGVINCICAAVGIYWEFKNVILADFSDQLDNNK
jgi:hypothetical protein